MMRARVASLVLVVASSTLSAQEPMRLSSLLAPHVSISGGVDLRNAATDYKPMSLGLVSLEWRTKVPGLGLRVDGLFARRSDENRLTVAICPENADCVRPPGGELYNVFGSKVRGAGAFVGVSYALPHGTLRPYVLGGVGAVKMRDRQVRGVNILCPTCNSTGPSVSDASPLSGAAQLGIGATYSWRWISLVTEAKYVAAVAGSTRGLNGAAPFSLGVRF